MDGVAEGAVVDEDDVVVVEMVVEVVVDVDAAPVVEIVEPVVVEAEPPADTVYTDNRQLAPH